MKWKQRAHEQSHIHGNFIYNQDDAEIQCGEDELFNKWCVDIINIKFDPYIIYYVGKNPEIN